MLLLTLTAGCATKPATIDTVPTGLRRPAASDLAVAIDGVGYFIVRTTAGGFLFTRSGELAVASNGELVNGDGYAIFPIINVAGGAGTLSITRDGVVQRTSAEGAVDAIGQLKLARFDRPEKLERDNLYYLPTAESGDPITGRPGSPGFGALLVGEVED